jgi:hypothetical protein
MDNPDLPYNDLCKAIMRAVAGLHAETYPPPEIPYVLSDLRHAVTTFNEEENRFHREQPDEPVNKPTRQGVDPQLVEAYPITGEALPFPCEMLVLESPRDGEGEKRQVAAILAGSSATEFRVGITVERQKESNNRYTFDPQSGQVTDVDGAIQYVARQVKAHTMYTEAFYRAGLGLGGKVNRKKEQGQDPPVLPAESAYYPPVRSEDVCLD